MFVAKTFTIGCKVLFLAPKWSETSRNANVDYSGEGGRGHPYTPMICWNFSKSNCQCSLKPPLIQVTAQSTDHMCRPESSGNVES